MEPLNLRKVMPLLTPLTLTEDFAQTATQMAFGKPKLSERRDCDWMELQKARLANW